jgi:hypothetical protein
VLLARDVGAHEIAQHLGGGLVGGFGRGLEGGLQFGIDAEVEAFLLRMLADPGHHDTMIFCNCINRASDGIKAAAKPAPSASRLPPKRHRSPGTAHRTPPTPIKLHQYPLSHPGTSAPKFAKVFWFFFSKKNRLLDFLK